MKHNRYSIDLALELDKKLQEMADKKGMKKADIIRRALALYALVEEKAVDDKELAIVSRNSEEIKYLISLA